MKKSTKILSIMVACAILALGFGFFVLNYRSSDSLPITQQANDNDTKQTENETKVDETPMTDIVVPTDWKTYTNDKHGFNIQYPTSLKAGSISDNSVLGTFQVPVRGYHVGPLVLVVLKDPTIKKDAQELFNNVYNSAKNPPVATGAEIPPVECKLIMDTSDKKAVACNGEGGAAKYGYVTGPTYDIFIDGYSKGYGGQDFGNITKDSDFVSIIQSISFGTKEVTTSNTTQTSTSTTTTPTTPPSIQSFLINADDDGATPNEISVTKGAIIQLTFSVGTNTYYGGLDFKSSVVNSGTVNAGTSKTISFKANDSFEFTPYWPASNTAKGYKIRVLVQ